MENVKRKVFDEFLKKEELNCFQSAEIPDEEKTVIYETYIQTKELGDLSLYVILDITVVALVRLVLSRGRVNADNKEAVIALLNTLNANNKLFKLYVEAEDANIYLDIMYPSGNDDFQPNLLYVLMQQVIQYVGDIESELANVLLPLEK